MSRVVRALVAAVTIPGCVIVPVRPAPPPPPPQQQTVVVAQPQQPPPDAPAPPPPVAIDPSALQPVFREFNGHHHMDSLVPGEGGYQTENGGAPLFRPLRVQQPGTIEVRRCYSQRSGDHMFSLDAATECPHAGYIVEGVLGYVYPSAVPGAVEVHRCWNGTDHMTTTNPSECVQNRYHVEGGFWAY